MRSSHSNQRHLKPESGEGVQAKNPPLIIYNDDTCALRYVDEPHTIENIDIPLRHLRGTQVGAICWCLAEEIAYSWPSKVLENYYEKLDEGHRIGLFDDESGFEGTGEGFSQLEAGHDPRNLMVTLYRQGIDYLPLLIDRARDAGIKFYGSFRMNDSHFKSDPKGMLSSRFWQENQNYRLWDVSDGRTYYNATLDYSFPEVRQRRLDAIQETLDWYDLDGVEVDFCRNPYTFPRAEAWEKRGTLTEFVRDIRRRLNEAGARRDRKLDLIMRVPFSDDKLRNAGMDVRGWLEEGLIDVLVMSSLLNDLDQDLEPWLSLCQDFKVPFYPSLEVGPVHNARHNHTTIETVEETVSRQRATAQNFIAQGAAGVYMFNYPCLLYQVRRTPEEFRKLTAILSELGRAETLQGKAMQYAFWRDLPLELESRRPARFYQTLSFRLYNADAAQGEASVTISFRQVTAANPHTDAFRVEPPPSVLPADWVTYILNGQEISETSIQRQARPASRVSSGFELSAHELVVLSVSPSLLRQGVNTLGFFIPKFPEEKDPYVYIYEVLVDVVPTVPTRAARDLARGSEADDAADSHKVSLTV